MMTPEVLAAKLDGLNSKLDSIHAETREDMANLTEQIKAHNGRLTKTETQLIEARVRDEEREKQIQQNRNIRVPIITSVTAAVIVMTITYIASSGGMV